ncbi:MAG: type II toxin-antitoxin system RelE/ParE family toxin [Nitrospirae bacterium]|nr:type II toxin-antitoxin system RelE/ParE family toxin [Nitrospirota bacterium]
MLEVEWTEEAIEDLKKFDIQVTQRIVKKVLWLSEQFDNITPESLSGQRKGEFKLKVGSWRVIYRVEKDIIVIYAVGHRSAIYK